MSETQAKKRRRTPLSCTACRKKKIKCDRTHPTCGHCLRSHTTCIYDGPQEWGSFGALDTPLVGVSTWNKAKPAKSAQDVEEMSKTPIGILGISDSGLSRSSSATSVNKPTGGYYSSVFQGNVNRDSEDTVSLVLDDEGKNNLVFLMKKNRMYCMGSFKRSVMWKQDPLMQVIMDKFWRIKKVTGSKFVDGKGKMPNPKQKSGMGRLERQVKLRKKTEKLAKVESNEDLLSQMAPLFPPRRIVDWHIRHFFDTICPFFPVLEQKTVQKNADRIIQYEGTEPVIDASSKLDFMNAAILILILRISYISLNLETDANSPLCVDDRSFILEYSIEASVLTMCKLSLQRFNFLRKTSIEGFQLLSLIRQYQILAPDDGDGGDYTDGILFVGLLTSYALSIGLNRQVEDSSLTGTIAHTNFAFRNLWGKMWWSTILADLDLSLVYGRTPYLRNDDFDTKFPKSEDGSWENADTDRFCIGMLANYHELYDEYYGLVYILHRVRRPPTVLEVEKRISRCLTLREKVFPCRLHDAETIYLASDFQSLEIVSARKAVLNLDSFILNVKYYIALHYEKKQNLDKFSASLDEMLQLLLRTSTLCIDTFNKLFATMSAHTFILMPFVIQHIEKAAHLYHFLGIRVLLALSKKKTHADKERVKVLDQMHLNVVRSMRLLGKVIILTRDHYYFSYRMTSSYTALIDWLQNRGKPVLDFSAKYMRKYNNLIEHFDIDHLKMINSWFESFLGSEMSELLQKRTSAWRSSEYTVEEMNLAAMVTTPMNDDEELNLDELLENPQFVDSLNILADNVFPYSQ